MSISKRLLKMGILDFRITVPRTLQHYLICTAISYTLIKKSLSNHTLKKNIVVSSRYINLFRVLIFHKTASINTI